MSALLRFNLNDLHDLRSDLKRLGGSGRAFLKRAARVLKTSTKERFIDETDPDGKKWVKSLKSTGQTMTLSGMLRSSISLRTDDKSAQIGTNRIYARIHQFGGVITAKKAKYLRFKVNGQFISTKSVFMPARPFLGVSETDKEAIKDELNTVLTEVLNHDRND